MADVDDDALRRQQGADDQGTGSDLAEIVGIVGADGLSGSQLPGDEHWTLEFVLEAWRADGGVLQTRPLTLWRGVPSEEFDSLEEIIAPGTVLRVRARISADVSSGHLKAHLESVVGRDGSDTGLNEYAQRMQAPVVYEDPILGTFTLDRRIERFSLDLVRAGAPLSLHLSATEPGELREALKTAHLLWESYETWNERMCSGAAKLLLPVRNEHWLGDDEDPVTAEEFRDRMALKSIVAYPDGSFECFYNDGDLFLGHAIVVEGSLATDTVNACIAG